MLILNSLHRCQSQYVWLVQKSVVQRLNVSIKFESENLAQIKLQKFNRSTMIIVAYSDGAIASSSDVTSQLERIIMLIEESVAAAID